MNSVVSFALLTPISLCLCTMAEQESGKFVVLEGKGRWIRVWKKSCSDDKGLEVVWKCTCEEEKIGAWAKGTFCVLPKVEKSGSCMKKTGGTPGWI